MSTAIIDGEKCVLMLCVWKSDFLKSGHIYIIVIRMHQGVYEFYKPEGPRL